MYHIWDQSLAPGSHQIWSGWLSCYSYNRPWGKCQCPESRRRGDISQHPEIESPPMCRCLGSTAGSCSLYPKYWPIRGEYPRHMTIIDQSEASIQVKWPVLTNQRPWLRSRDHYRPIRGQHSPAPYPPHMSPELSKVWRDLLTGSVPTRQETPEDGWNISACGVTSDQSEASIEVMWPVLTNQRPVLRSRDQYWQIRGQHSPVVLPAELPLPVISTASGKRRGVYQKLKS